MFYYKIPARTIYIIYIAHVFRQIIHSRLSYQTQTQTHTHTQYDNTRINTHECIFTHLNIASLSLEANIFKRKLDMLPFAAAGYHHMVNTEHRARVEVRTVASIWSAFPPPPNLSLQPQFWGFSTSHQSYRKILETIQMYLRCILFLHSCNVLNSAWWRETSRGFHALFTL